MKQIDNKPLVMAVGEDRPFQIALNNTPPTDAHPADLIQLFLVKLPVETMDDADRGHRLLEAIRKGGDVLEMDDSDRSWLAKQVETWGPKTVGIIAVELRSIVANAQDPTEDIPEEPEGDEDSVEEPQE